VAAVCQHFVAGVYPQELNQWECSPQIWLKVEGSRSTSASCLGDLCSLALADGPFRGFTRSSRWERLSHGLYVLRDSRRLETDLAVWGHLIILGYSALHLRDCTVEELLAVAAQRRHGAPLLRTAIPLLDGRSESPWESALRVLHVAAEVEVEPQKKLYDEWGNFVARADLWVVGTRRIHEYDGEMHRDREIHRADLARERRLVEINWQRIGFTSPQLLYEGGSIIAGFDRLLGRAWDPRRLARWDALLDDSLLRSSGRARAVRRWRRST
jgi:hypothetical protein